MSPAGRTTAEIIAEALEHFDIAINYSQRDLSDQIVIDAVAMRLSAGVEALGALDPDTRTSPWRPMAENVGDAQPYRSRLRLH